MLVAYLFDSVKKTQNLFKVIQFLFTAVVLALSGVM